MSKATFAPSSEQQQVIAHRGGHLQVIAAAGSGKTEAVSRRVCSLIEEGVEAGQIVAFTFTERAAESLKNRVTRRVAAAMGDGFLDKLGAMYVGTIHAYCLKLLQDHIPDYGNYDILDENRLAGLLSREYKRLDLSKIGPQHWRPIHDFMRNADVVENELIDRKKLLGTPFGDCYNEFCKTLDKYHFMTYGRLIAAAVHFLQTPAVFDRVHGQLRHLIVDEYQDVNPAQEKLISILARDPVQLCVVADDHQSIYQWRGSDVSHMLEFASRYSATALLLSVNRRSRPGIIARANTFAASISPRLAKSMEPHREAGGPEVHAWAAETAEDEARVIADAIGQMHRRGFRYKDVAVLYRSVRSGSPPLIEELKARGIPFRCAGRTGLFLQPEARVLGMLYAWLSKNDWKSERYGQSQPVTLDDLDHAFGETFNGGQPVAGLRQYLTDWKGLTGDTSAPINLVREYYRLLNLLGVRRLDLDDPEASARLGTLARFSMILADFEHVTRRGRFVDEGGQPVYRGGTDRGSYFYQRLFNYLQYYALDAYEDFEGEDTFDLDCVDILTVHQSKGLEWPVVFMPGLVQGRFPSKFAGQAQDWLIPETAFPPEARRRYEGSEVEERRLFYVAMTRARDVLYLSRFRKLKNNFKPSPFLVEVAGGDPAVAAALPQPGPFTPPPDEPQEQPTVSFSELSLYEQCPLRFRFSTSLGFQPQLATELGYGKAIHHILRKIADLTKAKGALPTKGEVEAAFRDAFYLPFANNASFHNLFDRARALVDRYLADYSGDLLRVWETERAFELHLDGGIVNGRADVILDREGGKVDHLAIVDYKTANDPRADDIFAFQLAIYASAGRGEGLTVDAAYLHLLKEGERRPVPVDGRQVKVARQRASLLIEGIVEGDFPARPEEKKCKGCDLRAVCKHAICGKYDL
jgi:DNA helicase-2/ATP-dependent DNA helicase PcrA